MSNDKKANEGGFDLMLAIPCERVKSIRGKYPTAKKTAERTFGNFNAKKVIFKNNDVREVQNTAHFVQNDIEKDIKEHAEIFCGAMEDHGNYELIFDESIKTQREPLLYGNVIIYKDIIGEEERKEPVGCYNFFCILSKLSIADDRRFNIIYLVVPDINYHDLTLLMDQSHDLWCAINGEKADADNPSFLKQHLFDIGYRCFEKIYHIVFSDSNQFSKIFPDLNLFSKENDADDNTKKIFNILAGETRKKKEKYSHQLELSDSTNEYVLDFRGIQGIGKNKDSYEFFVSEDASINLTKKEKFYDEYNMYGSYRAFASLYTYYYIINEKNFEKDTFVKRITPNKEDEDFSSEANILFVLETELFKVAACLVLNREISDQMNNPDLDLEEIRKMFRRFFDTRPLFEKLNYRYLGAQKEADFIYKQFQIGDIITDYDRKRELLRNYSETINSIVANNTSKAIQIISMVFAAFSGFYAVSYFLSDIWFDDNLSNKAKEGKAVGLLISLLVSVIIIIIIVLFKKLKPIRKLKDIRKRLFPKKPLVTK